MDSHYNQNYTINEIEKYLDNIRDCVENGAYSVALNDKRQENKAFIQEYNIRSDKIKEIILQINAKDFCHSLQNTKRGYEDEILYVFVPRVKLFDVNGEEEYVEIYTKFNLIVDSQQRRTVVISFHKRNKPIDYLFRE